MKRDKKFKGKR